MAQYLPAGFKVLTDELRASAQQLDHVHTSLDLAVSAVAKFAHGMDAPSAMEDMQYGSARPGASFDDYWSTASTNASSLVADIKAMSGALTEAANAYDAVERANTASTPPQHQRPPARYAPASYHPQERPQ